MPGQDEMPGFMKFQREMYNAGKALPTAQQAKFYGACLGFFFEGKEPESLPRRARDLFEGYRPSINRFRASVINGAKNRARTRQKSTKTRNGNQEQVSAPEIGWDIGPTFEEQHRKTTGATPETGTNQTNGALVPTRQGVSGANQTDMDWCQPEGASLVPHHKNKNENKTSPLPPPSTDRATKSLTDSEAREFAVLSERFRSDFPSMTQAEQARFRELYQRQNAKGGEER